MPTVSVNGIDLYYESHGSGAPLIMLGGLGLDVSEMGVLTGPLAERFRVIAIDNRGSGRSARPAGPYSIEQMATVIPDSRLALFDGGHLAPLVTAHQRIVSEITTFLGASQ